MRTGFVARSDSRLVIATRDRSSLVCGSGHHAHAASGASRRSAKRCTTSTARSATDPSGKGDGPAAHLLTPRPRDFTTGRYKIRSTETGSLPTDEDLAALGPPGAVRHGDARLADDAARRRHPSRRRVREVAFAALRGRDAAPIAIGAPVAHLADERDARARRFTRSCSAESATAPTAAAPGAMSTEFEDDWRQPLLRRRSHRAVDVPRRLDVARVYMRFRAGMSGTPMPSFKDAASDAEMWDLANYVVSLARKPVWEMTAEEVSRVLRAAGRRSEGQPGQARPVSRRDAGLHALPLARRREAASFPGMRLAGGLRIHVDAVTATSRPAISPPTRKPVSATGPTTEIKRAITQGVLQGRHAPAAVPDGLGVVRDDERRRHQRHRRLPSNGSTGVGTRCRRRDGPSCPCTSGASSRCSSSAAIRRCTIYAGNAGSTAAEVK